MSTIYDIAGTSANSFNLNGKVTLLQGDEAPQIYQGVDGDVYFRTNGLIYSKQNGTWLNLTSTSLPDAATGDGKFIVSNGQNYEFYDLSINDIAFLSRNNVFTGSNTFTDSNTFTGSNTFTDSNTFSGSNTFTDSNTFSGSNTFTDSNTFSGSNTFTDSNTFSGSNTFTGNNTYTGINTFNKVVQGTAFRTYWGDLAEIYETDKEYPKGTLVKFGGDKEITIADTQVNAVISSEPGLILNTQNKTGQAIALIGRVPVRVIGNCKKFDYLTLSDVPGVATVLEDNEFPLNVIARALENKDYVEEGLVRCVIKFDL